MSYPRRMLALELRSSERVESYLLSHFPRLPPNSVLITLYTIVFFVIPRRFLSFWINTKTFLTFLDTSYKSTLFSVPFSQLLLTFHNFSIFSFFLCCVIFWALVIISLLKHYLHRTNYIHVNCVFLIQNFLANKNCIYLLSIIYFEK